MPEFRIPWIEISIVVPLLGAVAAAFLRDARTQRRFAVGVAIIALVAALFEFVAFLRIGAFEARDAAGRALPLLQDLVIDELSAPLLPLTAALFLAMLASLSLVEDRRFSIVRTLLLESVVLATFSVKGGWAMVGLLAAGSLLPWMELRGRDRGAGRVFGLHALVFVGFTVVGHALMPEGAELHPDEPGARGFIAGALLTIGVLVRCGSAPFHCWMTELFERGSFTTATLFALPMVGPYAMMRLVLPVAPDWALQSIALVSIATAVYAAGIALVEPNPRRFFAYVFVSQSALVLAGLEFVTPIGLTGALCLWLSLMVALGGLAIAIRAMEARFGVLPLDRFHGHFAHAPVFAGMFLLTGLAAVGFPGTVGFVPIDLLLEGAVGVFPVVGVGVVVATTLLSMALLHAYFRIFTGATSVLSEGVGPRPGERIALIGIALLVVAGGLFPGPIVHLRYHATGPLFGHRGPAVELGPDGHLLPVDLPGASH